MPPADESAQQRDHEQHFVKRARERFGLRVSPARYRAFMRKVTEQEADTKFLGHQPPNRTVWRIRAGGHLMRVVFDHVTERLVTCLPYGERDDSAAKDHRQKLRRLRIQGKRRGTVAACSRPGVCPRFSPDETEAKPWR